MSTTTGTREMLAGSGVHGLKVAAADTASDVLVDILYALLGDNAPDVLSDPDRIWLAKIGLAAALHYAAERCPGIIPQNDRVKEACGLITEAAVRDFVGPKLATIRPLFSRLAEIVQDEEAEAPSKGKAKK